MKINVQPCNLVVDVGNTLTKVAIFCNDDLTFIERYPKITLQLIEDIVKNFNVTRAIISSVGESSPDFETFFPHNINVLYFTAGVNIPLKNCYKTPSTLGTDRLALAVAANTIYPNCNVLVIDSGTAITYDIITEYGEYMGGAISPGIEMRFKALNTYTAKLPLLAIENNFPLIGTTTKESMLSGVLNGTINEVDGYIQEISKEYPLLKVVFTGGNANFFDKKLKNTIFVHPNLLIFGLNRILNYNE
ncbi:MAG: type III pantothenate kinase [Bacteroidales bacterium]|nr:type III pantothenate kinase [Bacteroidales bacterium]MDD4383867.1 type III pantothenate kinase [Bacteroidales bacterium]MDY0196446.1 type III pantothenate kinase [Tenuifilaceae bacterium]